MWCAKFAMPPPPDDAPPPAKHGADQGVRFDTTPAAPGQLKGQPHHFLVKLSAILGHAAAQSNGVRLFQEGRGGTGNSGAPGLPPRRPVGHIVASPAAPCPPAGRPKKMPQRSNQNIPAISIFFLSRPSAGYNETGRPAGSLIQEAQACARFSLTERFYKRPFWR